MPISQCESCQKQMPDDGMVLIFKGKNFCSAACAQAAFPHWSVPNRFRIFVSDPENGLVPGPPDITYSDERLAEIICPVHGSIHFWLEITVDDGRGVEWLEQRVFCALCLHELLENQLRKERQGGTYGR